MSYPRLRALRIERFSSVIELGWHTTRVSPGALRRSAERSERAFGTLPPVAGETVLSGAGSGQ